MAGATLELAAGLWLIRQAVVVRRSRRTWLWPAEPGRRPNARSLTPVCALSCLLVVVYLAAWTSPGDERSGLFAGGTLAGMLGVVVQVRRLGLVESYQRFESTWRRSVLPWQRRIERLALRCARGTTTGLLAFGGVSFACGIAVACAAPALSESIAVMGGSALGLGVLLRAVLPDVEVAVEGELLSADAIARFVEDHPLGADGLSALLGLYGAALMLASRIL